MKSPLKNIAKQHEQLTIFNDPDMKISAKPLSSINNTTIIYEHPLNDQMRISLRLEHLHHQFENALKLNNETGSRIAMMSLLKTITVLDRPDIKSKLVQTLSQHASTLAQLEQFPQVDKPRLKDFLSELDFLIHLLHQYHGKIGEKLCQNDFLNQIRLQLNNPAGATNYRNPAYANWLAQPIEKQKEDLMIWSKEFINIYKISETILKITRQSTPFQTVNANDGIFHQTLDASLPTQMIQISLAKKLNYYPEISVGRHRLNIRFLVPDYTNTGRAIQSHENFSFGLNCCR